MGGWPGDVVLGHINFQSAVVLFGFRGHGGHFGKIRIWRKSFTIAHPLRLQLRDVSEHIQSDVHAQFQFKWLAESAVPGDPDFDMLGENFGHDRG